MEINPIFSYPRRKVPQVAGKSDLFELDVTPNKIFVAASVANQAAACRLALQLSMAGFTPSCRWAMKDFSTVPSILEYGYVSFARHKVEWGMNDLEDLEAADTLIVLADVESTSGGFHSELGYFLGRGRTNILVIGGPRNNVYQWAPCIRYLSNNTNNACVVEWLINERARMMSVPATDGVVSYSLYQGEGVEF